MLPARISALGFVVSILTACDSATRGPEENPPQPDLRVSYDSVSGVAVVTWDSSDYPGLEEYLLYRTEASDPSLTETLVLRAKSSPVSDTLFSVDEGGNWTGRFRTASGIPTIPAGYPPGSPPDWQILYTLRVRRASEVKGPVHGSTDLRVIPPTFAHTFLEVERVGVPAREDSASPGDTVRLALKFANRTRTLATVRWGKGWEGEILRSTAFNSNSGADTLTFPVPDSVADIRLRAEAIEADGTANRKYTVLRVVPDPPRAFAGNDTSGLPNSEMEVRGSGSDGFGRIVAWEWDIGNTGTFKPSTDGKALVKLPPAFQDQYECVLRVTDDDGMIGLDTLRIRVTFIRRLPALPQPREGMAMVEHAGKVYVIGGAIPGANATTTTLEYDTLTRIWRERASMNTARKDAGAAVFDGKIHVFGGNSLLTEVYDPSLNRWETGIALEGNPSTIRYYMGSRGGKAYYWIYFPRTPPYIAAYHPDSGGLLPTINPSRDVGLRFVDYLAFLGPPLLGSLLGDHLVLAGTSASTSAHLSLFSFDGTTKDGPPLPSPDYVRRGALIESGGRLYFLGGPLSREVHSYAIGETAWRRESDRITSRWNMGTASSGMSIFIAGGSNEAGLVDAFEQYPVEP